MAATYFNDAVRNRRERSEWSSRTQRAETTRAVEAILTRMAVIQGILQACRFDDAIPDEIHTHTRDIQVMASFIRSAKERDLLETLADVIWWSDDISTLTDIPDGMSDLKRAHLIAWDAGNAIWDVAGAVLREEVCVEPAQFPDWNRKLHEAQAVRRKRQRQDSAGA